MTALNALPLPRWKALTVVSAPTRSRRCQSGKYLQDWSGCAGWPAAGDPAPAQKHRRTVAHTLAICHAHGQAVVPVWASLACVAARCRAGYEVVVSLERYELHRAHRHRSGHRHRRGRGDPARCRKLRDAGASLRGRPRRAAPARWAATSTNAGGQPGDPLRQHPRPGARPEVVLADGTVLSMLNQMGQEQRRHGPSHRQRGRFRHRSPGVVSAAAVAWREQLRRSR